MTEPARCGCCAPTGHSPARRRVIAISAAGLLAPLAPAAAVARPATGDRLVEEDAEGAPRPLTPTDLRPGVPLLAYPLDLASGEVRSGSRLNKLVLMRFDEAELDADSRARAAAGVLAFSAVCTHQGCDLKTWSAREQLLVCFCHSSKFRLKEGGAVAAGPAPRALPTLPLRLENGQLVVAGGFSAAPGGAPV